ncbi:hypothetical protein AB0D45_24040 [Streptomyces sp. NPDC048352]|uniref:hypothetical protein n=1 Tax=Streptomyces sp. NPDC048352 TaxID=3154718 RepID=UPI003416B821
MAAEHGPAAAAAVLAAAPDVADTRYAVLLHDLVTADPAAWTADPPAVFTVSR